MTGNGKREKRIYGNQELLPGVERKGEIVEKKLKRKVKMKEDKRRQVKRREEEMSLPDKSCTSRKPKEK